MMSIVGMIVKEVVVIGYKEEITWSVTLGWKLLYVVLPGGGGDECNRGDHANENRLI